MDIGKELERLVKQKEELSALLNLFALIKTGIKYIETKGTRENFLVQEQQSLGYGLGFFNLYYLFIFIHLRITHATAIVTTGFEFPELLRVGDIWA
ncbi:hypothetical protein CFP56_037499 [Quercus suber]|uniref:Uncharacterized protein n=1 Tax=Quercus suber TaxID=58331 RepID=A0AAW0J553_QUESU